MKRIALVFLLTILLPAVLLAGLALRSLRDQELVLESQRTRLLQSGCDSLADRVNDFVNGLRAFHGRLVEERVAAEAEGGEAAERDFGPWVRSRWSQAAAAVVIRDGRTVVASGEPDPRTATLLADQGDFLTNRRAGEVYQAPPLAMAEVESNLGRRAESGPARAEAPPAPVAAAPAAAGAEARAVPPPAASVARESLAPPLATESAESASAGSAARTAAAASPPAVRQWKVAVPRSREAATASASDSSAGTFAVPGAAMESDPAAVAAVEKIGEAKRRTVTPARGRFSAGLRADADAAPTDSRDAEVSALSLSRSALSPELLFNEELVAEASDGALSRLLDGRVHLLLWKRHPSDSRLTFWTEIDLGAVRSDFAAIFAESSAGSPGGEASFALLDSEGALVAQTVAGFAADWSRPFVATEIGPTLPHWEVAAYLLDPAALGVAARKLRLALWLVILALLGAVAGGSALVLRSVGDEMKLAARKTDFVGNVSHELKTPLTSIRMFSELLCDSERSDPAKVRHYSEIISRESARLARLINRLLDFSRLDRGELRLERRPLDLGALVEETVAGMSEPLAAAGLAVEVNLPDRGGPRVEGDRDALAQVVVNLLGNAIRYASGGGRVDVGVAVEGARAVLSVGDRGPGVPRTQRRRIFERFYRVDDSISSGIDGFGIGLALCRQVAEQHGGSIRCEARSGGGAAFRLELPILT